MLKNYAIITVKNNSNRLPNKALLELVPHIRSIEVVIERAKRTDLPVIVATSIHEFDDIFQEIAVANKVEIFRGSEINKIKRIKDCFDTFKISNAFLIGGNHIMYDYDIGKRAIKMLENSDIPLITPPENIINGYFYYAAKKEAIDLLHNFAPLDTMETDDPEELIIQSKIVTKNIELNSWEKDKPFRLSLGHDEDLRFFTELIKGVGISATGKMITEYLDAHPEVAGIARIA